MAVFLSLSSGVTVAGRDTPVLGYWSIRGLAEPIRLLHAYVGKPLEEHRWGRLGSRPHVNRDVREWLAFKRELEVAPSPTPCTRSALRPALRPALMRTNVIGGRPRPA